MFHIQKIFSYAVSRNFPAKIPVRPAWRPNIPATAQNSGRRPKTLPVHVFGSLPKLSVATENSGHRAVRRYSCQKFRRGHRFDRTYHRKISEGVFIDHAWGSSIFFFLSSPCPPLLHGCLPKL